MVSKDLGALKEKWTIVPFHLAFWGSWKMHLQNRLLLLLFSFRLKTLLFIWKFLKERIFRNEMQNVCVYGRNLHSFVMQINMFVLKCTGTLLLLGPYGALSVDARLENCKQWSCLRECWIFTTSIIAQIEFNEAYSFLMKWGRNLYSIQGFFRITKIML